jgi:lipopolysaccharide/colanic/teichoic acid biosynthesis glycosyltransferase
MKSGESRRESIMVEKQILFTPRFQATTTEFLPSSVGLLRDDLALAGAEATVISEVMRTLQYADRPQMSTSYRLAKHTLDIAVAVVGTVLLAPLFAIIALLIRLESPGPAFFVQARVGHMGRLFPMLKFRTMQAGHGTELLDLNGAHKVRDDPRVTRIGRFLRQTSLDELPQIINVLQGQMSLVGPRPELPPIVLARYQPWQYERFLVPQGMTGWWQVTGRGTKLLCEHTEDDLLYIQQASFWFDLRILFLTVCAVLKREGAF